MKRQKTTVSACDFVEMDNVVGSSSGSDTLSSQKMKAIARRVVAAVLAAMAIGVHVGAEPRIALTVRLYNTSGISARELLAARDVMESTFQDSGLDVIVRQCGPEQRVLSIPAANP